jgi:hypothetical protein
MACLRLGILMGCIQNLRCTLGLRAATLVDIRKLMNLSQSIIRLNVVVVGVRLYLGALWLGGNG